MHKENDMYSKPTLIKLGSFERLTMATYPTGRDRFARRRRGNQL